MKNQKQIALIFEKSFTRTRCAFEVATFDQGAHVTCLGPSGSQIGHKESMKDTARIDVIKGKVDVKNYDKYVITIFGSELARGGARCMTMPIKRKPVNWI